MLYPYEEPAAEQLGFDVRHAPATPGLLHVEGDIPFTEAIYRRLQLRGEILHPLNGKNTLPYLAWETVRLGGNPFFVTGTGFEGYLVGLCQSADQALQRILEMSHEILEIIAVRYRLEYGFRQRLMATLVGDKSDPAAIEIWSIQLGAALAKWRCFMETHPEAIEFRLETYRRVKTHPRIAYSIDGDHIHQTFEVCPNCGFTMPRMSIMLPMLKPCDQEAWVVADSIGRFGHPLVRQVFAG